MKHIQTSRMAKRNYLKSTYIHLLSHTLMHTSFKEKAYKLEKHKFLVNKEKSNCNQISHEKNNFSNIFS